MPAAAAIAVAVRHRPGIVVQAGIWQPAARPVVDVAHRVLLPLAAARFAARRAPRTIDGVCFEPKEEYHVTLVGSALAARLSADGATSRALDRLLATIPLAAWHVLPGATCLVVQRPERPSERAIVQLVEVPAAAPIYVLLAERWRIGVPPPPLHVTLYWAGDPRGIGLPSQAALEERLIRPVVC